MHQGAHSGCSVVNETHREPNHDLRYPHACRNPGEVLAVLEQVKSWEAERHVKLK